MPAPGMLVPIERLAHVSLYRYASSSSSSTMPAGSLASQGLTGGSIPA